MDAQSPVSILARWIPILITLGGFFLVLLLHARRSQALQREAIDATRQNTEALNNLRQQTEKQGKS